VAELQVSDARRVGSPRDWVNAVGKYTFLDEGSGARSG